MFKEKLEEPLCLKFIHEENIDPFFKAVAETVEESALSALY